MIEMMLQRGLRSVVARSSASALLASALVATSLCTLGAPRKAAGHGGGLPASLQLLQRGGELVAPTPGWGIFVGREGGEWRWICHEAINLNEQPRVALSSDGQTMYATDLTGLTISPDGGCSWSAVGAPLGTFAVVDVVSDPTQPGRAYALANDLQNGTQTGVYKTDDRGQTWSLRMSLANQVPTGMIISSDGQKVAATTMGTGTPRAATLSEVGPTGAPQSRALTLTLDGQPLIGVTPIAYDGGSIYLRTNTDTSIALHRLDGTSATAPTRVMTSTVQIYTVARAPQDGSLLVGTHDGLYQQQADQSFKRLAVLSASYSLLTQGGALYSAASNFAPDLAAIAKFGGDVNSFTKVFRYAETKGAISCPASTSVGSTCPQLWQSYAEQLIEGGTLPKPDDLGGTPPPTNSGGSCALTAPIGRASDGATCVTLLAMLTSVGLLVARRRRPIRVHAAAPRRGLFG